MALLATIVTAQHQNPVNQLIWLNGRVMCANPISTVDSMTFANEVQMDTLHMLLPRTLINVVHDTVIKTDTIVKTNIVYVKDTIYTNNCDNEGIGVFSVSADKKVSFSKGNLQYQASTNTWRFAENQYDTIGIDNENISSTYEGWIDLFGWSADNATAPFGISLSRNSEDYLGDFVDWGTNTIGTDAPNTWRTLSQDEWYYLFCTRTNAQQLFALGSVNGINGVIILPDNWVLPTGVIFTPSVEKGLVNQGNDYFDNSYNRHWLDNSYTLSDWHKMEKSGAVFLPAAGFRDNHEKDSSALVEHASIGHVQNNGNYWASAAYENNALFAYYIDFTSVSLQPRVYNACRYGFSVRLVRNIE